MQLTINGEHRQIDAQRSSLAQLLTTLSVQRPDTVAVQLNGEFVGKESYGSTELKDGDEVEFLYFMGGGQ
jgi:sulfur carrier protein